MPRHPIQVISIRVAGVTTQKRQRRSTESDSAPFAYLPRARVLGLADDLLSFEIGVRVRVRVPLQDEEVWTAAMTLEARFVSHEPVPPELASDFARYSGLFIVWPYARVYLDQLAAMSGVSAAPLPLLSRPRAPHLPPVLSSE